MSARAYHESIVADALRAVWRRRYLVLGTVGLALALALGTLAILPRKYASEAIVQLDLGKREGGAVPEQASAVMLDATAIVQSEAKIIRSRLIVRRVINRLGLADDARYAPKAGLFAAITAALWPKLEDADETMSTGRIAAAEADLMSRLSIETDNRSYLITIVYASDSPAEAARIANAIAEEYLQRRIEANFDAANRMAEWLASQIEASTAALRVAEDAAASYRERTGLLVVTGEGESVQQQQLRDLGSQLSAANLAHLNAQGRLSRAQELARVGNVPSATDLQGSPLIQHLLERAAAARKDLGDKQSRFGPRHPEVIQAQSALVDLNATLTAEVKRAVSVVESDVAAALRTELDLRGQFEALQRSILAGKGGETELRNRQAAAQAVRDRLAALSRNLEQALALRDLRPVAASLIVPAEPLQRPSSPKPSLVLMLALLGGLGTGSTAAVVIERGDRGFRSSTEVKPDLEVRCLGMVPDYPSNAAIADGVSDQAAFDEAVRSVGAAVGLFGSEKECRVVLVTSSVADEGKSVLCCALAEMLVSSGRRVLMIDDPSRRDRIASDTAVANDTRSDQPSALARSPGEQLVALHRSPGSPLMADLFSSGEFTRLLEEARKHFDVILLEGPPVLLVADSLVIGRVADTVIHAVRWASTKRRVVEAALRTLQDNSVVVDGLVLTCVDLKHHARLGFADQCSFYSKEKRYYERLSGRGKPRTTDVSSAA